MDSYKDDYTVDSSTYYEHKKCDYILDDETQRKRKSYIQANVKYKKRGIWGKFFHPKEFVMRLDTGADTSMFNKETAQSLCGGFPRYSPDSVRLVVGVSGRACIGTIQYLDIKVEGTTFKDVPVVFPVDPINEICEYLSRVSPGDRRRCPLTEYRLSTNLLGWEGFFERLLTSFDSESVYFFNKRRTAENEGGDQR